MRISDWSSDVCSSDLFTQRSEVSFLLAKDKVEVAKERMRVTRAEYRGQDTKGRPFALVAGSAVQKSSAEPIVRMTDLSGAISLDDGPATIDAEHAQYDMDRETGTVPGTSSEEHTYNLQAQMRLPS